MTRKFKKQLKKRLLSVLVAIISIIAVGLSFATNSDLFVMPAEIDDTSPKEALSIENSKTIQEELIGIVEQSENVVVCESLVQGIRDCDLPDGTYTFRVARKYKWYITRNKRLRSRTNKLL